MATLVCPNTAESPERSSTPAPLGCGAYHTSPEGAQRIPGTTCPQQSIPGFHFIASGLVWYAPHPRGAGVEERSGLSAVFGQTNVAMSPLCLH
jgi:hypothetical protein